MNEYRGEQVTVRLPAPDACAEEGHLWMWRELLRTRNVGCVLLPELSRPTRAFEEGLGIEVEEV